MQLIAACPAKIVEVCRYTMKGNSFLKRIQYFLDTWMKSWSPTRAHRYLHSICPVTTIVLVDFKYDWLEQFPSPKAEGKQK